MVKISGWVYLAIGAVVSLFSRYVQNRGGKGLAIFFWAGVALIGFGIFKIVTGFITRDRAEKKDVKIKTEKENKFFGIGLKADANITAEERERILREKQQVMSKLGNRNAQGEQATQSSQQNVQQTPQVISCPMCGTNHYSNSNFCHMCGARLK
jgi:hypothetical protein